MKKISLKGMSNKMKVVLAGGLVVLIGIGSLVGVSYKQAKEEIQAVELIQTSEFNGWDGEIGAKFNQFLENEEWYSEVEDGNTYVYCKGSGYVYNTRMDLLFKFYVNTEQGNFELVKTYRNGQECNEIEEDDILYEIFGY